MAEPTEAILTLPERAKELIERKCLEGDGTKVVNCVSHMGIRLTERPGDCHLCSLDVKNHLRLALSINEWLNKWKDDASELFRRTWGGMPRA